MFISPMSAVAAAKHVRPQPRTASPEKSDARLAVVYMRC